MRALSIRQPWASAILNAGKSVENRTWSTSHRGELLIHAGLRDDPAGFERLAELGVAVPDDLPRGGVIGRVQLVDVVTDSLSPWAIPGCWHWIFEDPEPLPFVPLRGQLGLFDPVPRLVV